MEISEDRILTVAAGITFFALLALFPAIGALVSLYGLFGDRAAIPNIVNVVASFLPGGAITVLTAELHRLISQKQGRLSLAFWASLAISFWSASGGIRSLIDGLNLAFEARETRTLVGVIASSLGFTIVLIGLGICFCYLVLSGHIDGHHFWPETNLDGLLPGFEQLILFFFCLVLIGFIYRFGPAGGAMRRSWLSWGGAAAAALWILATMLFSWYVNNYGSYDRVYGSLGAIVGFLTWIWLLLVILLSGAELNCEIDRRSLRQHPPAR